jgi:hypothetical protein
VCDFSGLQKRDGRFGASLLSAAHLAAFDFFCSVIGEGYKMHRFPRLAEKAVIFTALKSLRRWPAYAKVYETTTLEKSIQNTPDTLLVRD